MKLDLSLFSENMIKNIKQIDLYCCDKYVIQSNVLEWSSRNGIKVFDEDYEILKRDFVNLDNIYIMIYLNVYKRLKGVDYSSNILDFISKKDQECTACFDLILDSNFYLFERIIYNLHKISSIENFSLTKLINACGISFNEIVFTNLAANTRITQENYSRYYIMNSSWSYRYLNSYNAGFVHNVEIEHLLCKDVVLYMSMWYHWLNSKKYIKYKNLNILNGELIYYMSNDHMVYNGGSLDVSVSPDTIIQNNKDILDNCYNDLYNFCNSTFKYDILIEYKNFTHVLSGSHARSLFRKYDIMHFRISKRIKDKLIDGKLILLEYNFESILLLEHEDGYYSLHSILADKQPEQRKKLSTDINLLLGYMNDEH